MDEQQFNLVDELDRSLEEGFRKIEELDIGSEPRKALHQELMEKMRIRIEAQKLSDAEDEHLWKEEREEKDRMIRSGIARKRGSLLYSVFCQVLELQCRLAWHSKCSSSTLKETS